MEKNIWDKYLTEKKKKKYGCELIVWDKCLS